MQRNLGWSLLFFVSSILALVLAAVARDEPSIPNSDKVKSVALLGFGVLFLTALWLLFRKRAYVVNLSNRLLTIVDRRIGPTGTLVFPLENVSVRMEQKKLRNWNRGGVNELWVGAIWLDIKGTGRIPFLDDLRGSDAITLAKQLAEDLGCALKVAERDDWL